MKLYLIDGSSYIYRAFYAIRGLTNSKGMPTNAIYGFVTMLLKVVREVKPDYLAVAFDVRGPTFREKLYKDYKANREEMPDELQPQIPYIKKITGAFNIPVIEKAGFEADDVLGTLVRLVQKDNIETVIITGDKDLMQLVSDKPVPSSGTNRGTVTLWDTMKDKRTGIPEVKARFGTGPDGVIDVFGLMGDASDNIPGVPGIGEKTAVKLIQEFGSLDNILAHPELVKQEKLRANIVQFADQARLSRQLATIDCNMPIDVKLEDLVYKEGDINKLRELFTELEFSKFLKDLTPAKTISYDDYHLVTEAGEFDKLIARLKKAKEFVIDTETTSKEPMLAEVVGISISLKEHEAFYIPLRHSYDGAPAQLPPATVLKALKPILESDQYLKIGQNIKYDMITLGRGGINICAPIADTMIAAYLLNPNKHTHNLEEIAREYLGHQMITYKDVAGTGQKAITFDKVDVAKATTYSAEDADATLLASRELFPRLKSAKLWELYEQIEIPLVFVLARIEEHGVKIDTDFLKELSDDFATRLDHIKRKIYQLADCEFNIDSPKQMQDVLYNKLGMATGRRTKTGFSTDSDTLAKLALTSDLPAKILEYRTLAKLKGTYIDALPELINPATGRLHTSFNQTITATGRLSSSDPNLQNIPVRTEEGRKIRQAFIPEKGHILISADYSQIELRLLAHFSKDKTLLEAFERNEDIHTRTACEIFNMTEELVTEDMRRMAKTINFGIIYGMSAHGLAAQLGISHHMAQSYIDHYFERYPGVKEYFERVLVDARKDGYVTTLMGRKRPLPEINSPNTTVRGFAERAAINAPLQGTAADIMKLAMINIHNRLLTKSPLSTRPNGRSSGRRGAGVCNTKMIMQVHDELVFETPPHEEKEVIQLVRKEMESAVELDVVLRVDISKGPNWAGLKLVPSR